MIPLRDTIPSTRTPWVARALVFCNVIMFIVEIRQGRSLDLFINRFGVVPANWAVGSAADLLEWPRQFLTLVTSQFLHGSILHLASNMLYLWIFGDNVEDRLGHGRFVLLYLGSGVIAAVTQLVFSSRSMVPMVGASGAIAGILGAYLLMFPSAEIETLVPLGFWWPTIKIPAVVFLGLWFVLQWAYGLTTIGQMADVGGVAFWAHIGGFVTGLIGVRIMRPQRRW